MPIVPSSTQTNSTAFEIRVSDKPSATPGTPTAAAVTATQADPRLIARWSRVGGPERDPKQPQLVRDARRAATNRTENPKYAAASATARTTPPATRPAKPKSNSTHPIIRAMFLAERSFAARGTRNCTKTPANAVGSSSLVAPAATRTRQITQNAPATSVT